MEARKRIRTGRQLAALHLPEERRVEEIASLLESVAACWDQVAPQERCNMTGAMLGAIYCPRGGKKAVALRPNSRFVVLFR